MAFSSAIKQLEERNVANEISEMVWSDRMDLVAICNVKGDVALHRLTWTRAWCLEGPKEGVAVQGLCWRPDGKVLAIAYSTEQVFLVSVENKTVINVQAAEGDISCLSWTQEKPKSVPQDITITDECKSEIASYLQHIDLSKNFIADPQVTSSSTESEEQPKMDLVDQQNELSLLLIGTRDGFVRIKIFGLFTCAVLNLNEFLGRKCSILNVHFVEDLSRMFVTVQDEAYLIEVLQIDSGIFRSHNKELFAIAYKYNRIIDLLVYLKQSITSISETWESILLEIDKKLSKYAGKVAQGGVTADFFDILMFGICSTEMEEFLINDLTKKGLEKFGETIDMSYDNIQNLLLKNVSKYGQNITFHLAELRGMARFTYKYEVCGLSENSITKAISANASFLLKAGEMQQIINHSIINYKAFFRWLYTAIMYVLEEPIPSDIHKMTQQDLAYITEFLQNFDKIGRKNETNKKPGFIMERLGQYLTENTLTIPPNMQDNEWIQFLDSNKCIKNEENIFKHNPDSSLIQEYDKQKITLEKIFEKPQNSIRKLFKRMSNFSAGPIGPKTSCTNLASNDVLMAFTSLEDHLWLVRITNETQVKAGKFFFTKLSEEQQQESSSERYQVVDLKFYSNTVLSVLLQEKSAIILQVSLAGILYLLQPTSNLNQLQEINGSLLNPKQFKTIDGMLVSQFSVSGSRRVGIVLAENKRKVRLFEMEAEDEDEDDAEMSTSMAKDCDVSMN